MLREAERSAAVTHNHPEGIKGAQAVALAVLLARQGADPGAMREELTARFGYDLDRTATEIRPGYTFDVSCQGSVPEALVCALEAADWLDAVRLAVSLGGDADTQACIAGALAEARFGGMPGGRRTHRPQDAAGTPAGNRERLRSAPGPEAGRTGKARVNHTRLKKQLAPGPDPATPFYVSIAGNIGVGKSMITTMIGEVFGWRMYFEPVINNPYLDDYYKDMNRWSFHLQVYFLSKRFEVQKLILDQPGSAVQDRTIYEDVEIFAPTLHRRGCMDDRDYENYREVFRNMVAFLRPPDLIIYLSLQAGDGAGPHPPAGPQLRVGHPPGFPAGPARGLRGLDRAGAGPVPGAHHRHRDRSTCATTTTPSRSCCDLIREFHLEKHAARRPKTGKAGKGKMRTGDYRPSDLLRGPRHPGRRC